MASRGWSFITQRELCVLAARHALVPRREADVRSVQALLGRESNPERGLLSRAGAHAPSTMATRQAAQGSPNGSLRLFIVQHVAYQPLPISTAAIYEPPGGALCDAGVGAALVHRDRMRVSQPR